MKSGNLEQPINTVVQEDVLLCDGSFINIKISDVLTPVTCALLINEILQGLLYQKSQIPYPYTWLKSVVEKKREKVNPDDPAKKIHFNAVNHFRIVSAAFDTLESIMKGVINLFRDKSDHIREIIFIFGPTPHCPKEIYSIKISSLAKGHLEKNHANPVCKYRQKILRNIFLSQHWLDAVDNNMTCTNTHVFIKTSGMCNKNVNVNPSDNSDQVFLPAQPVIVAPKVKHIRINLNNEFSENSNCCDKFLVFEDIGESNEVKENQINESEGSPEIVTWYQYKDLFKGFKDCYINKVSASELW